MPKHQNMKDTRDVTISVKKNVVDRARSAEYNQVTGHVRNETALEFKAFCARERLSISEAMELALDLFLLTYQDKSKLEKAKEMIKVKS